ncbi:MAG: ribonuclease J, partial [Patescibacteria group bacterium]
MIKKTDINPSDTTSRPRIRPPAVPRRPDSLVSPSPRQSRRSAVSLRRGEDEFKQDRGGPKRERAEHAVRKKDLDENGVTPLRFVPLGGLEEIGRNSMFYEYKNEIVVIDLGLQFPEEETPGIDYIIPNISYLEKKKTNVQAVILTHAHYDHIGAIPHVIEKLGNPLIYATSITKAIIEKRQDDFPNSPKLNIQIVKDGDIVKISNSFEAEFFGVPHTVPETTGVVLKTPVGNMVHFADFRIEYDEKGVAHGLDEFERIGKLGIHTFTIDSTNAEKEGHSISEKTVEKNLEEIFRKVDGRLIVATFASLLTRIAEIIKIAEKIGRRVALNGYSMKTNVQIAQNLGFIKAKEGTLISVEEIHKLKDDKT